MWSAGLDDDKKEYVLDAHPEIDDRLIKKQQKKVHVVVFIMFYLFCVCKMIRFVFVIPLVVSLFSVLIIVNVVG